jgi:hypothetical protein
MPDWKKSARSIQAIRLRTVDKRMPALFSGQKFGDVRVNFSRK